VCTIILSIKSLVAHLAGEREMSLSGHARSVTRLPWALGRESGRATDTALAGTLSSEQVTNFAYEGRRSGRSFATSVLYRRDDDRFMLFTPAEKTT
jgi:hypothetical protein